MNCQSLILELSNYLDGELDPQLLKEVERHLVHCPDCRLVVDTTRKTIEIYCGSEPAPLPRDIHDRLHRALAEKLRRTGS